MKHQEELPGHPPAWDRDTATPSPGSLSWGVRRLAGALFRESAGNPLSAEAAGATSLLSESGSEYRVPVPLLLEPELPELGPDWPLKTVAEPDRHVWRLEEAILRDDDGVILNRERRALRETLVYWHRPPHHHPVFALPRARPARHLPGLSLFLGGLGGQTFFHFLTEILPQFGLLSAWQKDARRVIVQAHYNEAKVAWLRRAGCTLPIEWLRPLDVFSCQSLLFTGRVADRYRSSPWAIATVRSLVRAPAPAIRRDRWLWAARRGAAARATPWEQNLIDQLPAPWEAVDLGTLTPAATLDFFADCAGFAGLHGAAFANLALIPPGALSLEVMIAPNYAWYPTLATLCGHRHQVMFAPPSPEAAVSAIRERLRAISAG